MTHITEIENRLDGITKGPWVRRINGCTASILTESGQAIALLQQVQLERVPINADFIAHAPSDIAYLLEERKRAIELLREARGKMSHKTECLTLNPTEEWHKEQYNLDKCSCLCKQIDALLEAQDED